MHELLSDHNKLNGMLKSVGYAIQANSNKMSIDDSSLEYLKFNQVKGEYTCLNEAFEEIIIKK